MSKINEEKLQAGFIFGDNKNKEYIYMPGSEIGCKHPICIIEKKGLRDDIAIKDALNQIIRLSLKPVVHPVFGKKYY